MKLKILLTGLLLGILVGCGSQDESSEIQQPEPQAPTDAESVETQQKETEPKLTKTSFPKESCGDSLPNDSSAYPINFFPVFVDYSESNLNLLKSIFCRDAFKKFNEKSGKDEIQVASFLGRERAEQFANLIKNEIGSGNLGNPTVLESKPGTPPEDNKDDLDSIKNDILSQKTIAVAAQLTSSQVDRLSSIATSASAVGKVEVIVPTYIPSGFRLESLSEEMDGYEMIYRNANNSCFSILAGFVPYASPGGYDTSKEVYSNTLGTVNIAYTEFDNRSNRSDLKTMVRAKGGWTYIFSSPYSECNPVSIGEAMKIIQSHEYLFPDSAQKLQFFSEYNFFE